MGGAVSTGRDNNELIDNLMGGKYIRTRSVERVFRALDRADYMTPEARDQAYKDLAWRNGPLHMSAPCIYSEVMEGLELKPGLSFLNIGSGTGYLSTLVGLILGSSGLSHGVEVHPVVVEYAIKKMTQFHENSPTLDEFDFCEPKFYCGNGLSLAPLQSPYDRVYCGAGCPEEYQTYFKQLIKVGGVLVMPLNDNLLQVRRVGAAEWITRSLLNVSFATLRVPSKEEAGELLRLDEQAPTRLQALARAVVRERMRGAMRRRHPQVREPPPRAPPAKKPCTRRIRIPVDTDSDPEGLNALHDLDRAGGANEMNALLSLVLSMGHNRVAGALRVDPLDSPASGSSGSSSSSGSGDEDGAGAGAVAGVGAPTGARLSSDDDRADRFSLRYRVSRSAPGSDRDDAGESAPLARSVIMFQFQEGEPAPDAPPAPAPGPSGADAAPPDDGLMPAEVEIYLGKTAAAPAAEAKREHSSDEATTESASRAQDDKRQKFDSGLGEENTPSSASGGASSSAASSSAGGSSPGRRDASDADDARRSGSLTDSAGADGRGRRRRQKRGHGHLSARASSSEEEGDAGAGRRHKRRAGAGDGYDARRVRLSVLMKRGVKELPLPHALKKYVNLGRCFEF